MTNYNELKSNYPLHIKARSILRDITVFLLSMFSKDDNSKEWIRFPFYHHVFDDERKDFDRHLSYMKNQGDFISIDDVVNIFEQKKEIGGRFFCVSFDDGFKNCVTNALPLLVKHACPAAFFLPAGCIGREQDVKKEILEEFFITSADAYPFPVEFLDWEDCRKLLDEGMLIGSHTFKHSMLKDISENKVNEEMLRSKKIIEENLAVTCRHFCCPWGIPGKHFRRNIDPKMAKETGYRSFLTAERGLNYKLTDPYFIKRDHLIAKWGIYQLRYFFSK